MASLSLKRLQRLSLWQPLGLRDFRLLWLGESVSLLGDQFHFVALAWLSFTFQILLYGAAWVRIRAERDAEVAASALR